MTLLLVLFTVLFLCGLMINSFFFFFPPSKLLAHLRSRKPSAPAPVAKSDGTKKRSDELETIFSTFDGDGDGFITAKELGESLRRLKLPVTPEEVQGMMDRADANGDGLVDAEEFRELCESLEGWREAGGGGDKELGLREAFEVFDGNRDGVITVEELGSVLVSMGLRQGAKAEDCRDMISRVDLDGDGKVNFEEFKKMMMMAAKGGKLF